MAKHGLHNRPTKHLPEMTVCCTTRSGKYCNLPVEYSPEEIDTSIIKVKEPTIPHIMKEVSLEDGAMDVSTIKQELELGEPLSPSIAVDVDAGIRNGPGSLGPTTVKKESKEME
ncbi:hypothetical protein EDB19DRAFT_1911829 [Suillus lakei]|nr:hypothetical protein EDB19DRAFT_1911829 [Suillus lakei]